VSFQSRGRTSHQKHVSANGTAFNNNSELISSSSATTSPMGAASSRPLSEESSSLFWDDVNTTRLDDGSTTTASGGENNHGGGHKQQQQSQVVRRRNRNNRAINFQQQQVSQYFKCIGKSIANTKLVPDKFTNTVFSINPQNAPPQQRPLTRYLPVVRNENFDLRAHIETAGHQIELCAHNLVLNSSSCRGYLHKMGARASGFNRTWNKRWFVFDRNKKTVVYYADKQESKVKGGVYFQAVEDVYVDHLNVVKAPNSKVTFCMKTSERTYYLMAPSPEAMRIWVDVIFTGAEGHQEFQNQC
jgi:hypothetical protein